VNALSTRFEVEIRRDGYRSFRSYDGGLPGALERGPRTTTTGTTVRFWPDPTIFETTTVDGSMLARHLQEVTFLNNGLTIRLVDERLTDDLVVEHFYPSVVSYTASQLKVRTFHHPDGLVDYVKRINRTKTPIHQSIVHFHGKGPGTEVEIAEQLDIALPVDVPVVLALGRILRRDEHQISEKSCCAAISVGERMNPHGLGMGGDP
jgi:DNA gyrase subunit B